MREVPRRGRKDKVCTERGREMAVGHYRSRLAPEPSFCMQLLLLNPNSVLTLRMGNNARLGT